MQAPGINRMQEMKVERQNEQIMIYLFVLVMYLLTFWIGLLGCSLFWVFIIAFVTFVMWKRKVFSLTERYIKEKEIILHRRKALQQSESCEWLNFVLNRWLVFCSNTASEVLKRKFDPAVQGFLPYFLNYLELKKLNVESKTPSIRSIQAFEVDEGNRRPVSWDSVMAPPSGLRGAQKYQLVVEGKVEFVASEFMELTARLSGRWLGLSLDISIEKLEMKATFQAILHLDMDVPFPHVSSISTYLTDKPDVRFGIRVLRHIQLMEIPLLKLWIHGMVTNILTEAFVDPRKLELNLARKESLGGVTSHRPTTQLALGIITVGVSGSYKGVERKRSKQSTNPIELLGDSRYCVISMGGQEFPSPLHSDNSSFSHSASFFVHSLTEDKVKIDLDSRMFLTSVSLASHVIALSKYSLEGNQIIQELQECALEKANESLKLSIKLEYSPLPSWESLVHSGATTIPDSLKWTKSGVVNVCVHGASDLMGMDPDGLSDPYCIVYNSGKKLISTHYVPHTRNPRWEVFSQFVVDDISKVVLSFVVYDWDGGDANDDDFLGSVHVVMTQEQSKVAYGTFPLNTSLLSRGGESAASRGTIVVSAVFIPVENISVPTKEIAFEHRGSHSDSLWTPEMSHKSDSKVALLTPQGILNVNIIQASNLVAKDRNGLSDPFCGVYIGRQRKFLTCVKKKTLNPVWNEQCTIELPKENETLHILLWDHDLLSKNDFLGCLDFSRKQLIEMGGNAQHDGWFRLEKVQSGRIQLKFQVFIQDSLEEESPHPDQKHPKNLSEAQLQGMEDDVSTVNVGEKKTEEGNDCEDEKDTIVSHSSSFLNGEPRFNRSVKSLTNENRLSKRFQRGLGRLSAFVSHRKMNWNSDKDLILTDSEIYSGIRVDVTCIEGLPVSASKFYCRVKLHSVIDHQKRSIAKSTQFVSTTKLPMDFSFSVDQNHGESRTSSLTFSIKSSPFSTLVEKSYKLADILPGESKKKRTSSLDLDGGVVVHLSCSFERSQVGCRPLSKKSSRT